MPFSVWEEGIFTSTCAYVFAQVSAIADHEMM
jgi:hypothetical protein